MIEYECYYCNKKLKDGFSLYSFCTKECEFCNIKYYIKYEDGSIQIYIHCPFKNNRYTIMHDLKYNKSYILENHKGKMSTCLAEWNGHYSSVTPQNANDKLKTLLVFL